MSFVIYHLGHQTYHKGGRHFFSPIDELHQAKFYVKDHTVRTAIQNVVGPSTYILHKGGKYCGTEAVSLDDLEVIEMKAGGGIKKRTGATDFMEPDSQDFRIKKSQGRVNYYGSGCKQWTSSEKNKYQNKVEPFFKDLRQKDSHPYALIPDYGGQKKPLFCSNPNYIVPWGYSYREGDGWSLELNPILYHFDSEVLSHFESEMGGQSFDRLKDAATALKNYFLNLSGKEKQAMTEAFTDLDEERDAGYCEFRQTLLSGGQAPVVITGNGRGPVRVSAGGTTSTISLQPPQKKAQQQPSPPSSQEGSAQNPKKKTEAPNSLFSDEDLL